MWDRLSHYILSSGGHHESVSGGGIAVVMKENTLRVEVRIWSTRKEWIVGYDKGIIVQPEQWFHLVIIWRPAGQLAVYINRHNKVGIVPGRYTPSYAATPNSMYIGRPNNVDLPVFYGTFLVDEMKYWNRVLTEEEISDLHWGKVYDFIILNGLSYDEMQGVGFKYEMTKGFHAHS